MNFRDLADPVEIHHPPRTLLVPGVETKISRLASIQRACRVGIKRRAKGPLRNRALSRPLAGTEQRSLRRLYRVEPALEGWREPRHFGELLWRYAAQGRPWVRVVVELDRQRLLEGTVLNLQLAQSLVNILDEADFAKMGFPSDDASR